jgi:hypothetical protein
MQKTEYYPDLEFWKEEVKLVAKRSMEQKRNILPSVDAVECTLENKDQPRSTDVFHVIDEKNSTTQAHLGIIGREPEEQTVHCMHSTCSSPSDRWTPRMRRLEGFHDRVNIFEDTTEDMIGCDVKRVEEECGGSMDRASYNKLLSPPEKWRDKFLAIAFIDCADKKKYADLQTYLSNDYIKSTIWYMPRRFWTSGRGVNPEDAAISIALMTAVATIEVEAVEDELAEDVAVAAAVDQMLNPLLLLASHWTPSCILPIEKHIESLRQLRNQK